MMMVVVCVAFGQTNNLQQIWTASQIISEFFYFSHCIFLSNFCEIAFAVCTHRYFEMQFSFTSDEIVLQFLGVVRISPWSNSTVTLFCTYQSTDYGRVIRAFFSKYPKWFFPIGQMVELIVGYLGYIRMYVISANLFLSM